MPDIKSFVRSNFPTSTLAYRRFRYRIVNLPRISFGFSGEDILISDLTTIFSTKVRYVDIGCAHPIFANNTYSMYRNGNFGVNIDARSGLERSYSIIRPRDIFQCKLVKSNDRGETEVLADFFTSRQNPHTSSANKDWVANDLTVKKSRIKTISLAKVFELHSEFLNIETEVKRNQVCLVLTIDVEGLDLSVLQSNDWSRTVPDIIAIEIFRDISTLDSYESEIEKYLSKKGYILAGFTRLTSFFIQK